MFILDGPQEKWRGSCWSCARHLGGNIISARLATIPSRPIKVIDNLTLPLKPWTDCKEEATVMADSETEFELNCFHMVVTLLFFKNTDLIVLLPTWGRQKIKHLKYWTSLPNILAANMHLVERLLCNGVRPFFWYYSVVHQEYALCRQAGFIWHLCGIWPSGCEDPQYGTSLPMCTVSRVQPASQPADPRILTARCWLYAGFQTCNSQCINSVYQNSAQIL